MAARSVPNKGRPDANGSFRHNLNLVTSQPIPFAGGKGPLLVSGGWFYQSSYKINLAHTRQMGNNTEYALVPLELIHLIIDHSYHDKATLATWALVSRICLPQSRGHQFHEMIGLPNEPGTRKLISLLDSPLCTIAPYIRGLSFGIDEDDWYLRNLPELDKRLPAITLLELYAPKISFFRHVSETTSIFQKLVTLHLPYVYMVDFEPFARFISSFPLLETLLVHGHWLRFPPPFPSLLSRHLHTLKLSESTSFLFLRWLSSCEPIPSISTLEILDLGVRRYLGEFRDRNIAGHLRNFGASLHHLSLGPVNHRTQGSYFLLEHVRGLTVPLDLFCGTNFLECSTELRSLSLRGHVKYVVEAVLHIHSYLKAPHMEHIRIATMLLPGEEFCGPRWSEMDHAITHPIFPRNLRRLTFHLRHITDTTVKDIKRYMPICCALGILHVDIGHTE